MKICLTAKGDNLDSQLDPRFGRCKYFYDRDVLLSQEDTQVDLKVWGLEVD